MNNNIRNDLINIRDICNNLIGITDFINMDNNKAHTILLLLKRKFENELKQIENGNLLPF